MIRTPLQTHKTNGTISPTLALLLILMTILTSVLSSASDWTQYTPSPTLNSINRIRSIGTTAMMRDSTNKIYYYNGTEWNEISSPVGVVANNFDIAEDGNYHWIFRTNATKIDDYTYDGITNTWNLQDTITINAPASLNNYGCINRGGGYSASTNECWLALSNGSIYGLEGTGNLNHSDTISELHTNRHLYLITTNVFNTPQYWNGVSFSPLGGAGTYSELTEYDNNYRAIAQVSQIKLWNSTAGTFSITPTGFYNVAGIPKIIFNPDTLGIYSDGLNLSYISKTSYYFDTTASEDTLKGTTQPITAGYIDEDTLSGWIGLNDGKLFYYGNPSSQTTNTQSGAVNYTLYSYTNTDNQTTNIASIQPIRETITYAVATRNNKLAIISYDHTNPNNILTNNLTTNYNPTPRSIDALGDTALIGTSTNSYLYNITLENVEQITLLNASIQDGTFTDDIISTYYSTADTAYACDAKYFGAIIKINTTTGGITQSIIEKCYDINSNSDGSTIYFYEGNNGVKIKNTSLTTINTIPITSVATNTPTDVLSTWGTHLSIATGRNVIKTYDITNPTNPTFEWECRTSADITAIESLSNDVIAVGIKDSSNVGSLAVCNKNDTSKYDANANYYQNKILKTITPTNELRRNNENLLFTSAETNQFSVYQLQIGQLATNNLAPIITSIELSTETPCINESVKALINAYDPDTPLQLGYRYSCDGTTYTSSASPEIYCTYTTTGIKNLKFRAVDANSNTTATRSISVQNCNLTSTTILQITIKDGANASNGLNNVLINIEGQTSATTNDAGYARLTFPSGTYNYTLSKTNYNTKRLQDNFPAGIVSLFNYLDTSIIIDENGNIIQLATIKINVKDAQNNPIQSASTSLTDPTTAIATTTYTDANGEATHINVPTNIPIKISIGKTGYNSEFTETSVNNGEIKTLNIILLRTGQLPNQSTGRGCQDYVNNWILCSPLNKSLNGDNCQTDNDCIGGRCQPFGICSNVNWTKCDEEGQDRGSWCATTSSVESMGKWLQRMILDNFLTFALFLIIILLAIILISKLGGRPR